MKKLLIIAGVILASLSAGAPAALEKEAVKLTTSDGVGISAYFVKASHEKGPAVVLLHMLSGTKRDWEPVIEKYLAPQTPFSYLAIDLRGHGESTRQKEKELSSRDFSSEDFNSMVRDVEAAVKYLRSREDVDPEKIAIVGASIGANIAINYAAGDDRIVAVALLSGSLDYKGVRTARPIEEYGDRPLFLAAAREDFPAGPHLAPMAQSARGRKTVKTFAGNLHGTRMFGMVALDTALTGFLKTCLE